MSNCRGCGSVVDPTLDEANQAVDDVLIASLKDAKRHGEICPLCGHSQSQPLHSDAIYRQSEIGNSFYKAVQRWDGNGWLTQLQDGSTIHFPESYSAENLAQGAPTEMADSAGNKIKLIRNPKRDLQEIRGPNGASIKLAYDDHDRIVRAEDGHGAWTSYTYDTSGFLTNVVHSDGTARYCFYEDGLLTFVRDEQERLLIHNFYDNHSHWLIRQQFGSGDIIQYRYVVSPNGYFTERTTLTLADGTVKHIETGDSVSDIYKRLR